MNSRVAMLLSGCVMFCGRQVFADLEFDSYPIDLKHYRAVIKDSTIEAAPKWKAEAENPPLSARKALKIANQFMRKRFEEDKDWKFDFIGLTLVKYDEVHWVWQANFEWNPRMGSATGIAPGCSVVILMDGTVVPMHEIDDQE